MNVDINSNTIAVLEKYTIEDILLVSGLIQAKKYDDMSEQYDNIQKCVSRSKNDPALNVHWTNIKYPKKIYPFYITHCPKTKQKKNRQR